MLLASALPFNVLAPFFVRRSWIWWVFFTSRIVLYSDLLHKAIQMLGCSIRTMVRSFNKLADCSRFSHWKIRLWLAIGSYRYACYNKMDESWRISQKVEQTSIKINPADMLKLSVLAQVVNHSSGLSAYQKYRHSWSGQRWTFQIHHWCPCYNYKIYPIHNCVNTKTTIVGNILLLKVLFTLFN